MDSGPSSGLASISNINIRVIIVWIELIGVADILDTPSAHAPQI